MKRLYPLLLLLLSLNCRAQDNQLYFEHLNVENGLPESYVTSLCQDTLGYIWIGTQNGLVRYDGYHCKVYKSDSEKSDSPIQFGVEAMCKDDTGGLWLYSTLGLFKYDRTADRLLKFGSNEVTVNNSDVYHGLIADANRNFWIYQSNTDVRDNGKLQMVNHRTGRVVAFPFQAFGAVKGKGGIWFGTTKGLVFYNSVTHKMGTPFLPPGVTDKQPILTNLYEASSVPGIIWFTLLNDKNNFSGLYSFNINTASFKVYRHNAKDNHTIASDSIFTTGQDSQGRLWFGTSNGISLWSPKSAQFTNYTLPSPGKTKKSDEVLSITSLPGGKLWLTSLKPNSGSYSLLLFDPSTGIFRRDTHDPTNPHSFNLRTPSVTLLDHTGILWIGTEWGGLDHIDGLRSQFNTYNAATDHHQNYPVDGVIGMAQGKDGACWLGSKEGLIKWVPNSAVFEHIILPPSIKKQLIVHAVDNEGLVWCSAANRPVFTYDPKTKIVDTMAVSRKWSRPSYLRIVYQDRSGLIWLGTWGSGLYSYQKGSHYLKSYPFEKSSSGYGYAGKKLDDGEIISIYQDKKGVIWIGTNHGGLNRFNPKDETFTSYYDLTKGILCISSIHEDKSGQFWAGSYLSGLFLFDRNTGQSRRFTEKNGLLHNAVDHLFEDRSGNLWIPSDRGITRFDTKTFASGGYTSENALPFNTLETDCYQLMTRDNQLIISTEQGILSFYPDRLTKNSIPPQIQIEGLSHSNPQAAKDSVVRVILLGKEKVELPYNQNRVTFNYVALHFANPAENKYAYQLQGYDKNWVQDGAQRSVSYTNLSPGSYTFKVKASSSDGVWNNKGAWVVIVIYPPWWNTWWAWGIYVILFIAAIYGFIVYRSRKLMRDNRILEYKVEVRTEEVKQQKEEIEAQRDSLGNALNELRNTQTQLVQREKMASLGELTAGIAHEIQNPLNFVNNFSEVNTELIEEMEQEIEKGNFDDIKAIAGNIKDNQQKISQHGKRADYIVKGMLEHSRTGKGEKQPTNINILADEFLKLSYHGLRAKDKEFNAEMVTNFDQTLPKVNMMQQDIGRVLLNLFNNAFYAVNEKKKTAGPGYKPTVTVISSMQNGQISITVKDNGDGIPDDIKDKIMQPFFTTKPTGEGTGLGLSLSYDIVVKGHGGGINVESETGKGSEFIMTLPV